MARKEKNMSELMKEDFDQFDPADEEQAEQITMIVDDDRKAERMLEYIRWCNDQKGRWMKYYSEQMVKITKDMERKIGWAEYLLNQYFRTVPHKMAKKSESYQLPSGKLVLKQQAPKLTPDDDALVTFLKDNKLNEFVKTETITKPAWGEFKKTLAKDPNGDLAVVEMEDGLHPVTADGVPVECVAVEIRGAEFKVEV